MAGGCLNMAANEKTILDLSAAKLKKLEKRDGIGVKHLILDNNELTKLDNMDCFPDLEKLSATGNMIIRMYGVSKCRHITHISLSNNSIICIEGLKDLVNLTFLNLSVNNIKAIQNLQYSENLTHLDLSKNNITELASISHLNKLKKLDLGGNKISNLNRASEYLPSSLAVLCLSENNISDLNEISRLVELESLEQLTISGNPCVTPNDSLPAFDYRPFVINWCLGLRLLDGYVATHKECLKAEWLYSQGKGRHFKPGEHAELVEYLAQVCPLNSDQNVDEEDEKLTRILHMQRQHKEQFLNEISQAPLPEPQVSQTKRKVMSKMSHSFHSNEGTLPGTPEVQHTSAAPSRVMYESAPEVLFHHTGSEHAEAAVPSTVTEGSPQLLSKSELLHSSARSPITIEQVAVDTEAGKPKTSSIPKSSHQSYDERRVRPLVREGSPVTHVKGTLVRKVSKRSTSPSVSTPSPGRPKISGSFRSKLSPSRSCILNPKLSLSKNSSGSDTSEEHSHPIRGVHSAVRRGIKSYSQASTPVLHQKLHSEPITSQAALDIDKSAINISSSASDNADDIFPSSKYVDPLSERFGESLDKLNRAAVRLQSAWRGYQVRHCNIRVYKLRQEIRFRRLEDHIQHLHGHMCRLTDFVLRQQKDLQHERELRKLQNEDLRSLHEKAKELQKEISILQMRAKQNDLQKVSEIDSYDLSNSTYNRKFLLRDSKCPLSSDPIKALQDISPDSPSSSLQYSTQAFQENSGLFSPMSQTSSIMSAGAEGVLSQVQGQSILLPSTSDLSDADSGLQSMVSGHHRQRISRNVISTKDKVLPLSSSEYMPLEPMRDKKDNHSSFVSKEPTLTCDTKKDCLADKIPDSAACSDQLAQSLAPAVSGLQQQDGMATTTMSQAGPCSIETDSLKENASADGKLHPLKKDASLSPIFPYPPPHPSLDILHGMMLSPLVSTKQLGVSCKETCCQQRQLEQPRKEYGATTTRADDSYTCNHTGVDQHITDISQQSVAIEDPSFFLPTKDSIFPSDIAVSEKSKSIAMTKARPSVFSRCLVQGSASNVSTPMEDITSPQSPCTVEMSGRISHSCSFQSDGFTAAEELSATTTLKLFSARSMSMSCSSNPQSPQTSIQRPLSLSEPCSQAGMPSPLLLASRLWEKKVKDIETTFKQLQAKIRELEGTFGHVGQISQILYPSLLSDDSKDSRHVIQCIEPGSGTLVLDMPKVNFRHMNSNGDFPFPTQLTRHGTGGSGSVPLLPPSTSHSQTAQNSEFCSIEELEQESQGQNASSKAKGLKLPLHEKTSSDLQHK